MPRYTLFLTNGKPLRATVGLPRVGWEVVVSSAPGSSPSGHSAAHELAHVVQQNEMSSAWFSRRAGVGRRAANGSSGTHHPEVGDEILVSFEHGDARHAVLILQSAIPGRVTSIDSSTIQRCAHDGRIAVLDLGAGGRRSLRLQVRSKGSSPLSILGGTSIDSGFRFQVRSAELL